LFLCTNKFSQPFINKGNIMSAFRLPIDPAASQIRNHLDAMKQAQIKSGPPSITLRKDRLSRAIDLLRSHRETIVDALCADYGNRSRQQTLLSDILAPIGALRFSRDHLDTWMAPPTPIEPFPGAKAWVEYKPLGVVGVISPWNFPIVLSFAPLADIFAAGNRAVLKPSELIPQTSEVIADLISRYFDADELTTVLGGPETGSAFSAQPFDHLIFTGGTQIAHHVMRSASEHLVPVTLELGGKSPVIVGREADLQRVAERVMTIKAFNAGQICVSPDYVLIHPQRVEAFVAQAKAIVAKMYPTIRNNPDYTAMLNVRGFDRQRELIADARAKGARIIDLTPAGEDLSDRLVHKVAPTLIVGVTDEMRVAREEIFGPLLPVMTYGTIDQAIAHVNAHPRPLALYYFGDDVQEREQVSNQTLSGAFAVNDAMTHVVIDALPFGGVGASGMGHYHGEYGFRTFSHARTVLLQSEGGESTLLMRAPYQPAMESAVMDMINA
jgi:coniferyl-aldehyde dehydrogenase